MAIGPGRYDDIATKVFEEVGIKGRGGVIVMVFDGNKGTGLSCKADLATTKKLPDILEMLAREIRKDGF
jgi:hypothetical protein